MALKHVSTKNLAKKTLDPGMALPWGPNCLKFMLAGHAVTTLVEKASSVRHTYYIKRAVDDVKQADGTVEQVEKDRWFVYLLCGDDNTRSYKYLGCVDDTHGARRFRTTQGTKKNQHATAVNINMIGDVIAWLVDGKEAGHKIQVWQRGICGRCAAPLTVPASIKTGLGPVCAKLLGVEMANVKVSTIEKLAALAPVEMDPSGSMPDDVVKSVLKQAAEIAEEMPVTILAVAEPAPEPKTVVEVKTAAKLPPHPIDAAISALVEAAGLPETSSSTIAALVQGLLLQQPKSAPVSLDSLRTKPKTDDNGAAA